MRFILKQRVLLANPIRRKIAFGLDIGFAREGGAERLHSAWSLNTLWSNLMAKEQDGHSMIEEVEYFCHPLESDYHVRGFEQLMALYHHHLINKLRSKFFSKFDLGELEEFAQRTWIKAWEHRGSFCARNPRDFRSWLFTIGINEVLQDFRKKRPGEMPTDYDQHDSYSASPEQFAIEQEHRLSLHDSLQLGIGDEELHKCLERLKSESPKWFDALISKILDESGEDAILAKHEIDRPTLSRWRWKAAQKVKDCIGGAAS